MPEGNPIARGLVLVLESGHTVVDRGNGHVQDIESGRFLPFREADCGRAISDQDLDRLRDVGRVDCFDNRLVYLRRAARTSKADDRLEARPNSGLRGYWI